MQSAEWFRGRMKKEKRNKKRREKEKKIEDWVNAIEQRTLSDLRGDLQIGGYCPTAWKSNCPVNQKVWQRSLNVKLGPKIGCRIDIVETFSNSLYSYFS